MGISVKTILKWNQSENAILCLSIPKCLGEIMLSEQGLGFQGKLGKEIAGEEKKWLF